MITYVSTEIVYRKSIFYNILLLEQEYNADAASSEFIAEFPCELLIQEHCWIHLLLTFHRPGMIKHSSCSCFLNGQLIDTKKVRGIL